MEIPIAFSNLEGARKSLDYIQACVVQMAQSLPQAHVRDLIAASAEVKLSLHLIRNFAVIRLQQWSSAFEKFLGDKHNFTEVEQTRLKLLRLYRVQMELTLTISFVHWGDEMIWDEQLQKFKAAVLHAEEFLQSLHTKENRPTFTLDYEIIMPLFITAGKCRDSKLRRKAIALLRSTNRQEGILNSLTTADILEQVVQMEEDGLDGAMVSATSIPLYRRVLGVEVRFDSLKRRAILRYVKMKEGGGTENIDKLIDQAGLDREYFRSSRWYLSPFK